MTNAVVGARHDVTVAVVREKGARFQIERASIDPPRPGGRCWRLPSQTFGGEDRRSVKAAGLAERSSADLLFDERGRRPEDRARTGEVKNLPGRRPQRRKLSSPSNRA